MTTALAKTVQTAPAIKGAETPAENAQTKAWKWTRRKRKAVRLILRGASNVQIAKELGVHRNTIRSWRAVEEFNAAVITEAKEYVNRRRFQRVTETGALADGLYSVSARAMASLLKGEVVSQFDLNKLQMTLREYREFRSAERGDFGDNVQRIEGGFSINISGDSAHTGEKGSQSFKRFLEEHGDQVSRKVIENAGTPQEALVEATRAMLTGTPVLDDIHDEEEAGKKESER